MIDLFASPLSAKHYIYWALIIITAFIFYRMRVKPWWADKTVLIWLYMGLKGACFISCALGPMLFEWSLKGIFNPLKFQHKFLNLFRIDSTQTYPPAWDSLRWKSADQGGGGHHSCLPGPVSWSFVPRWLSHYPFLAPAAESKILVILRHLPICFGE